MTILILSIVIAAVSSVSFFIIKNLVKKNKSLKYKLEFEQKQIEQRDRNAKNYKTIIDKLNQKGKYDQTVKNNINSASGAALSELANSL